MKEGLQISKLFFALGLLLLAYLFYRMLAPFLVPLIFGLILVSLFHPNYKDLDRLLGGRRNLSALIMCTAVTLLIVLPTILFSLAILNEFNTFYEEYRQALASDVVEGDWRRLPGAEEALGFLSTYLGIEVSELSMGALLDRISGFLLSHTSSILGGLGALLFLILQFFLMVFSLFFFFRDGELLLAEIRKLIPLSTDYKDMLLTRLKEITHATFFGIFATGILQGIAAGLIFYLLGIGRPILWGTATAIFSLVPVIGTTTVWVPMSVYLILQGSWLKGLLLLVLGSTVIGMVDNLIRPLIIGGRSRGLHLLLVSLSLLGGISLFGPSGVVLGPLVMTLLIAFLEIYKKEYRKELEAR